MCMKVFGNKTEETDREQKNGLMEMFIKEILKMTIARETANLFGKTEIVIREIGRIIKKTVMAFT